MPPRTPGPLRVRVDADDLRVIPEAVEQEADEAARPGGDVEHAPAGHVAKDGLRVDRRHRRSAAVATGPGARSGARSGARLPTTAGGRAASRASRRARGSGPSSPAGVCLLYTSDAADA